MNYEFKPLKFYHIVGGKNNLNYHAWMNEHSIEKLKNDGCEITICNEKEELNQLDMTDEEKIRFYLNEIYTESSIITEKFGEKIVKELKCRFKEDNYEITKQNVIEEILCCYMEKKQDKNIVRIK